LLDLSLLRVLQQQQDGENGAHRGRDQREDDHAGPSAGFSASSRRGRRRIVPESVCGSLSTNSTTCGHLKRAIDRLQNSMISSSVAVVPGFSTTTALTASPVYGCGMPTTAASAIFGWRYSASSTSRGYTLK